MTISSPEAIAQPSDASKDPIGELVRSARNATDQGKWLEAESLWQRVRDVAPDNVLGFSLAGHVALERGDYTAAERLLSEATCRFPSDTYAHIFYAQVASRRGDRVLAASRIAEVGAVTDPVPYRIAFDYLLALASEPGQDSALVGLIIFLLLECPRPDPDYIPVVLACLNGLEDRDHTTYKRIVGILENYCADWRDTIEDLRVLDLIQASTNTRTDMFDLVSFAARELSTSSSNRIYALFHRTAVDLLAAARKVLGNFIENGQLRHFASERILVLTQVASFVDPHLYGRIWTEAAALPRLFDNDRSILGQGAARRARRSAAAINRGVPDRPLRIALCVSGQLRGFQEAAATWPILGLDQHDCDTFVHVWRKIGRKFPVPQHAERIMGGQLLKAYQSAWMQFGEGALRAWYPSLFELFGSSSTIDERHLEATYRTSEFVIEDDEHQSFSHFNSFQKMYYKVKRCQDLAELNGRDYDLYIRIRPDKSIHSGHIDYHRILYESRFNASLFVDAAPYIHCEVGYVIGDQFAIGDVPAMRVYASAYDQTDASTHRSDLVFPSTYKPHVNFAFAAISGGLTVRDDHGIVFGSLLEPTPFSATVILEAIERDVAGRRPVPADESICEGARSWAASCFG